MKPGKHSVQTRLHKYTGTTIDFVAEVELKTAVQSASGTAANYISREQ